MKNSTRIDILTNGSGKKDNQTQIVGAADTAKAGKKSCAAGAFGKFSSAQALLSAYESLEAEFTRRSQRLKELEEKNKAQQPSFTVTGAGESAVPASSQSKATESVKAKESVEKLPAGDLPQVLSADMSGEPSEAPIGELTEVPIGELNGQPTAELIKEPTEAVAEEPTEQPESNPVEQPEKGMQTEGKAKTPDRSAQNTAQQPAQNIAQTAEQTAREEAPQTQKAQQTEELIKAQTIAPTGGAGGLSEEQKRAVIEEYLMAVAEGKCVPLTAGGVALTAPRKTPASIKEAGALAKNFLKSNKN